MDVPASRTLSAEENVYDVMESLIRSVPEQSTSKPQSFSKVDDEPRSFSRVDDEPSSRAVSAKMDNRRIMKMKQQVAKQNKFINDTKKQIRTLAGLSPKTVSDREELAFLNSRLDKENDLLKKLLNTLIEEQKKDSTQAWEPIRLCTDAKDDICRNQWMLGVEHWTDQRFSFDSTLSSLSSGLQMGGESGVKCGDVNEILQKELMNRDRVIAILQSRMEALTADVMKVQRDNEAILDTTPKQTKFCEADMLERLHFYKQNTDALEKNLHRMGTALSVIRSELGMSVGEGNQQPTVCSTIFSTEVLPEERYRPPESSKAADDQHNTLLKELSKKTEECKKLTDRLARSCSCQNESPEVLELNALKTRCSELLNERDEFKALIEEQAIQCEEYREKYLKAQQMVEEQKLQMEKLDATNHRIEEQINLEIQRIKSKFQDKLRQLAPFPRLLETEEQKVRDLRKSNEKLFNELKKSAKEIKSLEARLHNTHSSQNAELEKAHNLLKVELDQLREEKQTEQEKREYLIEKLSKTNAEMEELRSETAKIITRTKDRANDDRKVAQAKLQALELELAKSRADAAVTIGNREAALREMQGQIAVLSGSFNDAQMQIHSLRNQLTFIQNERYGARV